MVLYNFGEIVGLIYKIVVNLCKCRIVFVLLVSGLVLYLGVFYYVVDGLMEFICIVLVVEEEIVMFVECFVGMVVGFDSGLVIEMLVGFMI